ncbi:MAG: hypothetical protein F4Y97_00400 [Dehalococcoidia bacterium]|nr:hypothetical protein [Dehalococcoidia bacterium]MYF22699.1 hypothetical protein [Chloroflexota bacterium]
MSAQARSFVGLILLDLGLVLLLCSWMLAFGLGLRAGLLAAVGLPLMTAGIVLERSWARRSCSPSVRRWQAAGSTPS